jgi:hypothetical protein
MLFVAMETDRHVRVIVIHCVNLFSSVYFIFIGLISLSLSAGNSHEPFIPTVSRDASV